MTRRFPILDDNERSPHWSRHQIQSTQRTPQPTPAPVPRLPDHTPARNSSTSTYSSTSGTSTRHTSATKTPEKTNSSGWAWIIVMLIVVGACIVAAMIKTGRISIPSIGLTGSQTPSATATPTFSVHNFLNGLQAGDCFTLEVSPSFSSDGTFNKMTYLHGEKADCSDTRAQYRFTSKETGATKDSKTSEFDDGNESWTFENGDRFNFALLARDGTFLITEWSTATDYIFSPYYLPDGYMLPAEAKNTGLIRVSAHGYGSCTNGSITMIDGQKTCWTFADTRSRPQ